MYGYIIFYVHVCMCMHVCTCVGVFSNSNLCCFNFSLAQKWTCTWPSLTWPSRRCRYEICCLWHSARRPWPKTTPQRRLYSRRNAHCATSKAGRNITVIDTTICHKVNIYGSIKERRSPNRVLPNTYHRGSTLLKKSNCRRTLWSSSRRTTL